MPAWPCHDLAPYNKQAIIFRWTFNTVFVGLCPHGRRRCRRWSLIDSSADRQRHTVSTDQLGMINHFRSIVGFLEVRNFVSASKSPVLCLIALKVIKYSIIISLQIYYDGYFDFNTSSRCLYVHLCTFSFTHNFSTCCFCWVRRTEECVLQF